MSAMPAKIEPVKKLPLQRRDGSIRAWALVDDEDYERLRHHKWYLGGLGYASRSAAADGSERLPLHREILGLQPGDGRETDHVNRDKLDNRRCNLRVVTRRQNAHNVPARGGTSRYRGVSLDRKKKTKPWVAMAKKNRKQVYLGYYNDEETAAMVAGAYRLILRMREVTS